MTDVVHDARARAERTARIRQLGQNLSPDMVVGTQKICAEALPTAPFDDVAIVRDIAYGLHERHVLDVYSPAPPASPGGRPVVVFVHGGGFVAGNKGSDDSPFGTNIGVWAVRHGLVAVGINYRLAPEASWPDGADDIAAALEWVRDEIGSFGGSADSAFLIGQSAGAMHVADYLGRASRVAPPLELVGAALISCLYDVGSAADLPMHRAYWGDELSRWADMGSLSTVIETTTPLFLAVAEFDEPQFLAHALTMAQQWTDTHGTFAPLHLVPGENHLSTVYRLGSTDDILGPPLLTFISEALAISPSR
ncbi:hypothetical protein GCM10010915_03560 [Microbacterium faecale]|uniref:BD-FAE-like domain-containing protein n=2 Tax=Microbacterium faecale TaxID=1804630 RepID=A0A916Y1G8_9MICO|nr:hypothetical protein GCM10010915_03560 [Microbacterium faecale]